MKTILLEAVKLRTFRMEAMKVLALEMEHDDDEDYYLPTQPNDYLGSTHQSGTRV